MSERFDDLLAGAVDSAAGAATKPGAEAARKRGRQRRNRQRLAASTLAVALLGGAGSIAAVSLGKTSGTPVANATSTATATSSPSVIASPSATASVSPSQSSASASTGATTPTASSNSSQAQVSVPAAGTYVAGGWLTLDQFPYATGYSGTYTFTQVQGTKLAGNVYRGSGPLAYCGVDGYSSQANLNTGATGTQLDGLFTQGVTLGSANTSPIASSAFQETLFYADAQHAQTALSTLPSDFQYCAQHSSGVNATTGLTQTVAVHQTLSQIDAQCWSALTTSGSAGTIDHYCFVRSGSVVTFEITLINQTTSMSELDFSTVDSNLVNNLTQALTAYQG